ncbi:hypothetical protein ACFQMB_14225 [Pseudobowmanella zhangzhouensis]|uniref:hypothetical protein n=1 Tax=Pseudobowmanella zhangzhouensis TaxID=1537679 RepID=UPI00360F79FA
MTGVDVSNFTGDYKQSQMAERFNRPHLVVAACRELVSLGHDRKSWMIFAASVDHGIALTNELCERGIDARFVDGTTLSGSVKNCWNHLRPVASVRL